MLLPTYSVDILLTGRMTCVIVMMIYRGGFLKVLFESFPKGPRGYAYVFIIAGKITALEPVYGPLLLTMVSLSLGDTSRFLMMVQLPFKWVCISYLPQIFLMLLQRPWVQGITVWPMVLTSLVVGWVPAVSWLLALSLTTLDDLVSLSGKSACIWMSIRLYHYNTPIRAMGKQKYV